jgi:hypothetical protein
MPLLIYNRSSSKLFKESYSTSFVGLLDLDKSKVDSDNNFAAEPNDKKVLRLVHVMRHFADQVSKIENFVFSRWIDVND